MIVRLSQLYFFNLSYAFREDTLVVPQQRSGCDRSRQIPPLKQNEQLSDVLTGATKLAKNKSYLLDSSDKNPMAPDSNKKRRPAMRPRQVSNMRNLYS